MKEVKDIGIYSPKLNARVSGLIRAVLFCTNFQNYTFALVFRMHLQIEACHILGKDSQKAEVQTYLS